MVWPTTSTWAARKAASPAPAPSGSPYRLGISRRASTWRRRKARRGNSIFERGAPPDARRSESEYRHNTMNDNQDAAQTARSHKPLLIVIFSIAAIVAAIFWWLSRGYESTDDASIQSDITLVAARVSGTVLKIGRAHV